MIPWSRQTRFQRVILVAYVAVIVASLLLFAATWIVTNGGRS